MSEGDKPDITPAKDETPELVHVGQEFLLFPRDKIEISRNYLDDQTGLDDPDDQTHTEERFGHIKRDIVLELGGVKVPFTVDADALFTRGHPGIMIVGSNPDAYIIDRRDYVLEERVKKMEEAMGASPESSAQLSVKSSHLTPDQVAVIGDRLRLMISSLEAPAEELFGQLYFGHFYPSDFGPMPIDQESPRVSSTGLPGHVPSQMSRLPELQTLKARFIST